MFAVAGSPSSCSPSLLLASPAPAGGPEPFPAHPARRTPRSTIEPALLKQALQDKHATLRFIVELHAQASLDDLPAPAPRGASPADARAARTARASAVVSRLRDTAASSQAALAGRPGRPAGRRQRAAATPPSGSATPWPSPPTSRRCWPWPPGPRCGWCRLDRWRQWVPAPAGPETGAGRPGRRAREWNIQRVRADADLGRPGAGRQRRGGGQRRHRRGLAAPGPGRRPTAATPAAARSTTPATGSTPPTAATSIPATATATAPTPWAPWSGAGGIGVAPGARWIAAKAFDSQGYAYDSWLHAALQWMLAPAGDPGLAPDVVNNSWGSPDSFSTRPSRPDLQALAAAGILAVFSAGNEGPAEGIGDLARQPARRPQRRAPSTPPMWPPTSPAAAPRPGARSSRPWRPRASTSAPARRAAPTRPGRAPAWPRPTSPAPRPCCCRRSPA